MIQDWMTRLYILHKIVFRELLFFAYILFDRTDDWDASYGAVAQLEERLICIQEVVGSIPSGSTIRFLFGLIAQLVRAPC